MPTRHWQMPQAGQPRLIMVMGSNAGKRVIDRERRRERVTRRSRSGRPARFPARPRPLSRWPWPPPFVPPILGKPGISRCRRRRRHCLGISVTYSQMSFARTDIVFRFSKADASLSMSIEKDALLPPPGGGGLSIQSPIADVHCDRYSGIVMTLTSIRVSGVDIDRSLDLRLRARSK